MAELETALRNGGDRKVDQAALDHLVDRFIEQARKEDLVEVAYGVAESPIGDLMVAVSPRGLVRVAFPTESPEAALQEIADRISPRILKSSGPLDEVRKELDEYFNGRRQKFELDLDLTLSRGFRREVLTATAEIPFGDVATYREVAIAAGRPTAVRAAASGLATNPIPIVVPCHRVVRTGKGLGGYGGGLDVKVFLLELEGVDANGL
jgi:methylated-DNA-[protein]-cysteine S-methyltransferase